ncbi:MAG TPA: hypothetical protein VFJ06_01770 [Halococcus sp.]|nr:hypothetical protein [Halococcus sp.]
MPLDDSEWEQLAPSKSQIAIMRDFLEDNPSQAYTLEEIADETEVVTASSTGGQFTLGSSDYGLAAAIGRVYLELLVEPLVEDPVVERRTDNTGTEYYRYTGG